MINPTLQTLSVPEWGRVAEEAVRRVPAISSVVLQSILFLVAPHQRKLGLRLVTWDKRSMEAQFKAKSRLRGWGKKTGTSDFAAAGELAAFLVLIRNVRALEYQISLKELNVVSDQTPSGILKLSCELDPQSFEKLKIKINTSAETSVVLKSEIKNDDSSVVAQVRSVWSIKKRK